MSPAKTSYSERLSKGDEMEMRVARLWFWEGYFSRSGIDLKHHYHPEPLLVTDIDLMAYDIGPSLQVSRTIGEVKTGTGKNAPKPLDRIIWLRGLKELVGADHAELVIGNAPSPRARRLARSIGVSAQSLADVERREEIADIAEVGDAGSHGERAFRERSWAHKHCASDPLFKRAFWFLRSEIWFHDEITACKRLIGLYKQLGPRWISEIEDEDSRALRWLLAETVSLFVLNAVAVASNALRSAPDLLLAELGKHLSGGRASADIQRQIAKDVDKFIGGILKAANAPPSVAVDAMGALHPEAPTWTEPFVDLISRIALCTEKARMLPRQIDLLAYERIVWKREVFAGPHDRLRLGDPDVGRLVRLVAAFLRGQSAHVEEVDRALTTPIKAAGHPASPETQSGNSNEEGRSPIQATLLDSQPQDPSASP